MSDKRRRYRKVKEEKRPIILAKREDDRSVAVQSQEIQPKLLLKTKAEKEHGEMAAANGEFTVNVPQKTIIVTRSENVHSPILSTISPNTTKEHIDNCVSVTSIQLLEPVAQMSRPATVVSSTGLINSNVRKLLLKANTDFLVVGVIGLQGVGKSTIMNILANEDPEYDYYHKIFIEEDTIFPIKLKQHKCFSRSRTESTHMYITSDRLILLDSPPVLCNSYKKDMTTNEVDDLRNIITFMSVCHLLIVVQDDYMNMSFMRLLRFAELMKPTHDNKQFLSNYYPKIVYLKNRAKREDYTPDAKARLDLTLKLLFEDSQLNVVTRFWLPEVKSQSATSFHNSLHEVVNELRALVFMTSRSNMCIGPSELTETIWFELLIKASQDTKHFFFNTYEDVHRSHLDVSNHSTNANPSCNNKDGNELYDNWRN